MSGDGFHVHGPHDHEVEHVAHKGDKFSSKVAVMTAVLATIGALFSYQGGATMASAGLAKNDAAIQKTEAANQWAYYQSKGNKKNLAEMGAGLTQGEQHEQFKHDAERYQKEQASIKEKAELIEKKSQAFEAESEHQLHLHHRWALAMTLIQVAISLAAITLLTRNKWLTGMSAGIGLVGLVLGSITFFGL